MPEYDVDTVTKEWLQSELRSPTKSLIVLDCRSSNEFQEGHIRSAVNFSIPSLILKRLASGKIDVTSTIKCRDLKQRIQNAYNDSLFVLYNETTLPSSISSSLSTVPSSTKSTTKKSSSPLLVDLVRTTTESNPTATAERTIISTTTNTASTTTSANDNSVELNTSNDATIINVLHRRLKQDGCHVYWLKGTHISIQYAYNIIYCV